MAIASNPAIENPAIENPAIENKDIQAVEVYNPRINPAIENPAIENPAIENPAIENPAIENVTVANRGIINPAIENPAIENPAIENPAIENPAIEKRLAGQRLDHAIRRWELKNNGNTDGGLRESSCCSTSRCRTASSTQLIVHRTYTDAGGGADCELKVQLHNNVLRQHHLAGTSAAHGIPRGAPRSKTRRSKTRPSRIRRLRTRRWRWRRRNGVCNGARDRSGHRPTPVTFSPAAAVTPAAVAQSVNTEDIVLANRRRRTPGGGVDDDRGAGVGRCHFPERQLRSAAVCQCAGRLGDRRRRLARSA